VDEIQETLPSRIK